MNHLLSVLCIFFCVFVKAEDHKGRKVICFGCTEGIGAAIATSFVNEGAHVVINSRSQSKIDHIVKTLSAKGKVFGLSGDCSVQSDIKRIVEEGAKFLEGIDTVIWNPTGSYFGWIENLLQAGILDAAFDSQYQVNVKGLLWATVYSLDEMIKSKKSPSVIATSAIASKGYLDGLAPYSAAKIAQENLIKAMAVEFAHYGIRFFATVPAVIQTSAFDYLGSQEKDYFIHNHAPQFHPMNRVGQPEEVAEVVTFLASNRASFMTGSSIPVDGGMLANAPSSHLLGCDFLLGTRPDRLKKDVKKTDL